MKHRFNLIFLLFSICFVYSVQALPQTVELVAVGDILLARGVENKIEKFGTDYPFEKVKHILSDADLAFGNLENPLTEKCEKIDKKYSFQAKPEYTKILRLSGLDILSLANNHSLDCGQTGLLETFKNLDKENLLWFGAGKNEAEAEPPTIIEKKKIKIAFLGFTAISPTIEAKESSQISFATTEKIVRSVKKAKREADIVIVSFHWGTEYTVTPNDEQKKFAKTATDAGADAVIGHHPHVLQAIQTVCRKVDKRRTLIAYSLGNFVFDSPVYLNRRLAESVILKMRFGKKGLVDTEFIPVVIENYRPILAEGEKKQIIIERLSNLSAKTELITDMTKCN